MILKSVIEHSRDDKNLAPLAESLFDSVCSKMSSFKVMKTLLAILIKEADSSHFIITLIIKTLIKLTPKVSTPQIHLITDDLI